ncbi:MAG: outer membrane lipoprotein carrier protein LolA [Acidobacteriota bacterium]
MTRLVKGGLSIVILMLGVASTLAGPVVTIAPELKAVLDRFEHAQQGIQSLRTNVVETRVLALLAKPEVLRGQLTFDQGKVRFEYREPEARTYVLNDGKLTGWIPAQNRVEEANVSRRVSRLKKVFALGQASSELIKDFSITLVEKSSVAGTDELVLVPNSKRIQKRIAEVRLWLDKEVGLPKQMHYVTGDGNKITYQFTAMQVNPEVPAATFVLRIPANAKVVKGVQSLGVVTSGTDIDEEL